MKTKTKPIEWIREGDCIIPTNLQINQGYPVLHRRAIRAANFKVARLILWRRLGFDLSSKIVCRHTCDNRKCINPHHIIAGSQADNIADMVSRKRNRYGITVGVANNKSKLTEDNVRFIRESKESLSKLAAKFGVLKAAVWLAKTKRSWKHVP